MIFLKNRFLKIFLVVSFFSLLFSSSLTVKAVQQDCLLFFLKCTEKNPQKALDDLFYDAKLDEMKNLPKEKREEIQNLLKSHKKDEVIKGYEILFNATVKDDFDLYIQGRATKENTVKLRKFYESIETARKPIDRDWSPMVNSWGLLGGGVNFGTYIVSTLFLDIQTQLPDVFGKFDYKDQTKTTEQKANEALSLTTGGKLRLDSIDTIDLNKIYYQLLAITIPLFGLYLLLQYATQGWYDWQVTTKMLISVSSFFIFIIIAPSLVSLTTLFVNTTTMATQQVFSTSKVIDVCKDDRTMMCAYKASFQAQANREAIYARPNQFYTFEEDSMKAIGNLISEIFISFIPLLLYSLNVIFGLVLLLFWKGSIMLLLVNLIFLVVLLPFALISPKWRLNWFHKMFRLQITIFAFTLCFNLATELILAVSTGGFAFWSISFVFLVAGFLIFQAMPLISEIFAINLSFAINPLQAPSQHIQGQVSRIYDKANIRGTIRKKFSKTQPYKYAQKMKASVKRTASDITNKVVKPRFFRKK